MSDCLQLLTCFPAECGHIKTRSQKEARCNSTTYNPCPIAAASEGARESPEKGRSLFNRNQQLFTCSCLISPSLGAEGLWQRPEGPELLHWWPRQTPQLPELGTWGQIQGGHLGSIHT